MDDQQNKQTKFQACLEWVKDTVFTTILELTKERKSGISSFLSQHRKVVH